MSPQCSGVGVAGAINVVELCALCNRGLNMMSGEACVHFIALPIHFLSGVGVPGAINVVDLCARCNRGLNMMLGEACLLFIALPIHFLGTHGPVHGSKMARLS